MHLTSAGYISNIFGGVTHLSDISRSGEMEGSLIFLGMFVQVGTNTAELGILGVPMLVVLPTNILEVCNFLHLELRPVLFPLEGSLGSMM